MRAEHLQVVWNGLPASCDWDDVIDMDIVSVRHVFAANLACVVVALHYLHAKFGSHQLSLILRIPCTKIGRIVDVSKHVASFRQPFVARRPLRVNGAERFASTKSTELEQIGIASVCPILELFRSVFPEYMNAC